MASASEESFGIVSRPKTRGSMADIMQLRTKLYIQEKGLRDLLQRTCESGQSSKENVKKLFSEIKEMLCSQELEICSRIDAKTSEVTQTVEQCLHKTEANMEFLLSVDHRNDSSPPEFLNDAVNDTEICLHQGGLLMTRDIVAFKVDASAKNKVENLKFGIFTDTNGPSRTDIDVDNCNSNTMVGMSAVRVTSDCTADTGSLPPTDHRTTAIHTTVDETTCERDTSNTQELRDASTSSELPSAPPLTLSYEDSPPTYWQAVGLPDPLCEATVDSVTCQEVTQYPEGLLDNSEVRDVEPSAPSYIHPPEPWTEFLQELHDNPEGTDMISRQWILRMHRSFYICSPDNLRKPIPVAMCSHNGIVCVADRNNSCAGFFTENGDFLDDAVFKSPIYDVQFFDVDGATSCFVATFPKEHGFKLLYFKDRIIRDRTRMIRPRPGNQYTSICKGPEGISFLGATTQRKPRLVMAFDYDHCQTEFLNDGVNFLYPCSCLSYGSNVIVSDWNLGLVCVFHKYGRILGRYTGTREYPLEKPTDMTIDPNGNIYIVSGSLSTIHVIDQECKFLYALKLHESEADKPKLIEYLTNSKRLAVVRESGKKIELFDFESVPYHSPERSGSIDRYGFQDEAPLWL